MNNVIRIPSKLYFDLWSRGNSISGLTGDKLIAVYSILKSSRTGEIKYYSFKSTNNKFVSGLSLIKAKTSLSLSVIKKYIPVLIEMGLCFIDNNGDFVMLGNEKVKELYNSYKLVPIKIGRNLTHTATNCISVRLHSEEKEQRIMISKKQHRSELLLQYKNPKNNRQLKTYNNLIKRYGDKIEITDKVVLSNQGYSLLKDGTVNNKSKGQYWKRKLQEASIIKSTRRFKLIEKMSYGQYKQLYKYYNMSNKYIYINGYLAIELVSEFKCVMQ